MLGFAGREAPGCLVGRSALHWYGSIAQSNTKPWPKNAAVPQVPESPLLIVSVATEGRKELGEINREWREGADIEGECSQHRKVRAEFLTET